MFQLIVAVISIALVAALAIASIFYGGEAFQKSSEKSAVTALVNQGQQIHAAMQLYKADNAGRTPTLENLTDKGTTENPKSAYLEQIPKAPEQLVGNSDWAFNTITGRLYVQLSNSVTDSACNEIDNQGGGCFATADSNDYGKTAFVYNVKSVKPSAD